MSLEMAPLESLVSYSPSIVTMAPSCTVCEIKWDTSQKRNFFIAALALDAPLGRRSSSEYCHTVRYGKTRKVSLPDSEKRLKICITVSTEYRRVTDRRTGRQTDILRRHNPH